MKRNLLFPALALTAITAVPDAKANDIYVYSPTGQAVEQLANVKRIELTDAQLTLVPYKGSSVNVPIDRFGFLSFEPRVTTGIDNLTSQNVSVVATGGIIEITSPDVIVNVTIYNTLGQTVAVSAPDALTAVVETPVEGLNIVVVETSAGKTVHKIVL